MATTLYRFQNSDKYKTAAYSYYTINRFALFIDEEHYGEEYLRNIGLIEKSIDVSPQKKPKKVKSPIINSPHFLRKELDQELTKYYLSHADFNSVKIQADNTTLLGSLSMDEYFITPSYIPEGELRKRESLIKREKQIRSTSVRRRKYYTIPNDFIAGSLLQNYRKIVVTGTPGIGKSTYAKWLCYKWAKKDILIGKILVYIKLGWINTSVEENCIVRYITKTYLDKEYGQHSLSLFREISHDLFFVLDGFDELGDLAQKKIKFHLDEISENVNFILLSRPYGLINNPGFIWEIAIQLDGFSEGNIKNYLDKFLSLNNRASERNKLLKLISENRVLQDYSHNPLMLSFITFLYLNEEKPEEKLRGLDSQFELQEMVLQWILKYSGSKKDSKKIQLTEASKLSYEMEVNKTPLWKAQHFTEQYTLANDLSSIGLGTINRYDSSAFWQFSFNTITFQEYLAAKELIHKINQKSFLYLINDRYFWNTARMIIGGLPKGNGVSKIKNIFSGIYEEYSTTNMMHYWFVYVFFLSEARSEFVKECLDEVKLDYFLSPLFAAYVFHDTWRIDYFDALARIYSKCPPRKKVEFQNFLTTELEAWICGNYSIKEIDNFEHIKTLINRLRIYNDSSFVKAILELCIKGMGELGSDKQIDNIEDYHDIISFLLEDVLCQTNEVIFDRFINLFEELIDCSLEIFIIPITKLSVRLNSVEEIIASLKENAQIIELIIRSNDEKSEVDKVNEYKLLNQLASDIYIIGRKCSQGHLNIETVKNELLKLVEALIAYLIENSSSKNEHLEDLEDSEDLGDFEIDEIAYLVISGLINFKSPQLYESISRMLSVTKPSYYTFQIPDNTAFMKFLRDEINLCVKNFDILKFEKIVACFSTIENVRNQFTLIRDDFTQLLVLYIERNKESFLKVRSSYITK